MGVRSGEILAPWRLIFLGGSELASRFDLTVVVRDARTSSPSGLFPGRIPSKNENTLRNFPISAHPLASHSPGSRKLFLGIMGFGLNDRTYAMPLMIRIQARRCRPGGYACLRLRPRPGRAGSKSKSPTMSERCLRAARAARTDHLPGPQRHRDSFRPRPGRSHRRPSPATATSPRRARAKPKIGGLLDLELRADQVSLSRSGRRLPRQPSERPGPAARVRAPPLHPGYRRRDRRRAAAGRQDRSGHRAGTSQAEAIVAGLAAEERAVAAALAGVRTTPRVFLSLQGSGLWTFGRSSYFNDLLRRAKAVSVTGADRQGLVRIRTGSPAAGRSRRHRHPGPLRGRIPFRRPLVSRLSPGWAACGLCARAGSSSSTRTPPAASARGFTTP